MSYQITRIFPPIIAVLILGICAWGNHLHPQPKDAEPYHKRVRAVADELSKTLGDWEATDQEVPAAAIALLRPNVIISRQYRNLVTGDSAQLLFVQCRDERDMAGHYPPVCYPAHGYTLYSQESHDWHVNGETIPGMRYCFTIPHQGHASSLFVYNFLMLPTGEIERNMDKLRRATTDYLHHFYGAAQMQLVFDGEMPLEKQEKIFTELVAQHLPLIHTVLSGAGK